MDRFNVFLDTNIFIGAKYNFAGGSLSSLKKHCENGTAALFTNDIVLREVQHHIDNDIGLLAKQAKNAIKNHGELVNAITRPVYTSMEETLLSAAVSLRSQFDAFMNGAIILSNEGLSVVDLFNAYFEETAPFEKREAKKSEFPDAVIIMSIKRYLRETNGMVLHIVTDDEGWHNALNGTPGVFVYKNLKDLLSKISQNEQELYHKIARFMGTCKDELFRSVESWCYEQDWSPYIDNVETCIECDEFEDLTFASIELVPYGIEYIDRDGGYAAAAYSGIATIHLEFTYIDHEQEVYDREDHIWLNTVYGKGIAQLNVPFSGSVTVLIGDNDEMELNSSDFDEIIPGEVDVITYDLTPYREDDDPYFDLCPDCGTPIGIHNDGGNGFCIECASKH